jgi:filamentous hemagglutinin
MGVTKSLAFGTKEWLKTAGKIAVVELSSNAGAYTVGALSDSLGLPLPITLLLAGGSGTAIASSGVKNMFADSDSIVRLLRGETDDVAVGRVALGDGVDGIDIRQMDLLDGVGNPIESGGQGVLSNGKISVESIKTNPQAFSGKNAQEIADMLTDAGFDVTVNTSTRSSSGAQIIKIQNPGDGRNISQVQVSPGGGRHGSNPYIKISTTDQGIIKIIDGPESLYKSDGLETSTNIFVGGKR